MDNADRVEVQGGDPRQLLFRVLIIAIGVSVLLFIAGYTAVGRYTRWLWFDSLGFGSVYLTMLVAKVGLFIGSAVVFLILLLVNILLARRFAPKVPDVLVLGKMVIPSRRVILIWVAVAIVISLILGGFAEQQWDLILKFLNAQPFDVADPIFDTNVAFYVFQLPVYRFIQMWLAIGLLVTLLMVAGYYALSYAVQELNFIYEPLFWKHASVLGAVIILLFTWGYWLDIYGLVLSPTGLIFGATYVDVNAKQLALWILMGVSLLCAAILVVNIFSPRFRSFRLPILGIGIWVVIGVLAASIYPMIVQRLQVTPNELAKETPFIENNIQFTRQAFILDEIDEQPYPAQEAPSAEDIQANPGTINNIRLWDHRPLLDTYNQNQAIRLYYGFSDADIDRYTIDGNYQQVMLAARELLTKALAEEAQTWVNQHLVYTHGYGLALSPVNDVTTEGLPVLLIKDLPPRGYGNLPLTGEFEIDYPEIYHGEHTDNYVIVNTNVPEFDYPAGEENVYAKFAADAGVQLSSYLQKLAYTWEFGDINIMISGEITPESRILYFRNVEERVRQIAPFLALDRDRYPVITDGKLYWIQDAYTTTNNYPYSQPFVMPEDWRKVEYPPPQLLGEVLVRPPARTTLDNTNYIRNSVKVVVDAYDGSTTLYVTDPADPIVNTYASIFPDLFTPIDEMPESLRAHTRYPKDLFLAQAQMYLMYHMLDPKVFYGKEDLWEVAEENYAGKQQTVEPYYIITRLRGETKEEYLLMLPFTPVQRHNTIGWMAARCDGEHYGKVLTYKFPKDKLIYGPMQLESRIDQDPVISQQFTLWGQVGSEIIRGNMLMIPLGESNLYVEPIFLQAELARFPELKQVIVSNGTVVAMAPTFDEALATVFGAPIPSDGEELDIPALIEQASQYYADMEESLREGDWAGFGQALENLESVLQQLDELASE